MENYKIEKFNFKVDEDLNNRRVDLIISHLTGLTRSFIKKSLVELKINGIKSKLSRKAKKNDKIEFVIRKILISDKIIPQNHSLKILFEDEYLLIVNKPAGIPVHPSFGHESNTLCNFIMNYFQNKSIFLEDAGIIHRLDMDTEGVIVFGKNRNTQYHMKSLFEKRKINKYYFAMTKGVVIPEQGELVDNLIRNPYNRLKYTTTTGNKGKKAKLYYKRLKDNGKFSFLNIKIITGRTHQIRVQFSKKGYPVIGDKIYSRNYKKYYDKYGLLLFSYKINFIHPITGEIINVISRLPDRFKLFFQDYFL